MRADVARERPLLRPVVRSSGGTFLLHQPLEPAFAEELNWMLGPDGSIPAAQVIGWAVLITSPADPFGVLWMDWEVRHVCSPWLTDAAFEWDNRNCIILI